MSWAKRAKEALRRGETAQFRPRGHAMRPKVNEDTWVQWLMPAILIVLRMLAISVFMRHGRANAKTVIPLSSQEEADLSAIVKRGPRA